LRLLDSDREKVESNEEIDRALAKRS